MNIFTRIFTVLCCAMLCFFSARAQRNPGDIEKAVSLVKGNAAALGLTDDDINNSLVSDFYTTADGITMLYLQQAYKGVGVYNKLQVAVFKNDKIVSLSGGRIPKIEIKVNEPNGTPQISAETAVQKAVAFLQMAAPLALRQITSFSNNNVVRFTPAGISKEDITVQTLWTPVNDKLLLTRQVFIAPLHTSDYWLVRVDAITGDVIEKTNLTVSCSWDKPATPDADPSINFLQQLAFPAPAVGDQSPLAINSGNYRVVPFPAESPIHPGGAHAVVTDPWTAAAGNATTLKWNSDGTTDYLITRGNNVHAHEDRAATNTNNGKADTSTTALPDLNFLQAPDYTQVATLRANQRFATTNLFYWNNIMHDIMYQYGFNEVSGNFQANNLSRGGAGNDYVQADAQDASGTNNANFATPVDGTAPRMQMYLFTYGTPGKDGDLDNGVICHEYGHGISNRLTGGPANASCLQNAEQPGEGWSDYLALMVTTNWTTATTSDGPLSRPIGNYVLNNTVTGAGIRNYPYSTNMAINPLTYASMPGTGGETHNIGEIWTAMLWDMTWNIIQIDGINPNIYNAAGTGGNSAALKLVMEGMRLQPCSPGFVNARDAILKADTLFFAARYSCAIWNAFARRGLGMNASQGLSTNYADGVADYLSKTGLQSAPYTINKTQVTENETIDYTTQITAGACGGISDFYITDTLPTNVTYISGGSYNAANRVVTFSPITLAAGASASYTVQVQVNAGAYSAPVTYLSETVPAAALPAAWTASGTTPLWTTSTTRSRSAPYSFFAADPNTVADKIIATTNSYAISGVTTLSFWHWYTLENGYDGGVVEVSTNGGSNWTDLESRITLNGYNGSIPTGFASPIAGRSAFTGNSGAFINTTIDLSSFSGQTIKIRFRMGSDNAVAANGWYIDDIDLKSGAYVVNKMNVYNASNVLQSAKTISTPIVPILVTSTGGTSTRSGYATLAAAITAINGGTIHTGTIGCSVITGYTEIAPAGGYAITATSNASNSITFQKNGTSANPLFTAFSPQVSGNINDAVFKIIGGDYITIRDFAIQENSASTTSAAATNNMTEFGVALFYASATNGAQHNTILNNIISLNRDYLNTFGIYSNARHTATAMTTVAEATSAAGSNSFNAVYGNAITNVNYGIVFIGAGSSAAVMDNGNDIGGTLLSTGNTISNWGNDAAASGYVSLTGSTYCIYADHQINNNVSYNTITSAALNVAAAATGGISQKYTVGQPSGTIISTVSNNTITITNTPITGNMVVINNQGLTALSTSTVNITDNNILNCVVSGPSATSASFTGISNTSACGVLNLSNNKIQGIISSATSASSTLYGLVTDQAITANVFGNTVNTVSATGGSIYGIYAGGGGTQNVYKNKVYDLSATGSASLVHGAYIPTGNATVLNFHNNYIGDLRNTAATNSGSAITGIYLAGNTASSTQNIYFNTVYLAAASSGADFSTSGIYHATSGSATTAALNLRNNVIVNLSAATGSGKTAAYRCSDAVLTNYAAASDNNLYYAGTPGANNLIYYDGTNADQSLAAFRYRVSPREDKSVSDNPAFLGITGGATDYLHIDPAIPSRLESGGSPISGLTDDYDGDARNTTAPDIGADEINGILKDSTRPVITVNTLADSCTGIRRVRATITDASGIPLTASFTPRIYYKKGAGAYQSVVGTYISGSTTNSVWDFIIDPGLIGAATGDAIDYFIVAQDIISTVANIGSLPSAGLYAADVNTIVKDPSAVSIYTVGSTGTAFTWAGSNTNWFSAANWCGGAVPAAANDAVIPAGAAYYPIIGSGTASTKNITIAAGASVTITGSGVFSLNGIVSNSGTFSLINGTLNLAGTGSVAIGGSSILNGTVKNLTISTTAAIAAGAGNTLNVSGLVSFLTSGNTFTTNGNLTLLSTAAGTASITDITHNGAVLLSGNSIAGNASVERYISAQRKWNFLSVNTATTQTVQASWMEGQAPGASASTGYGLWVTDAAGTGANFDAVTSAPTIKWWNGSSYTGITNPASYPVSTKNAYMTYVRGDRSSTGSNNTLHETVLRIYGSIIQNSPAATVIPAGAGFTAVGNPYPSAIDLTKLSYSGGGTINVQVWDPNLTGSQGLGAFQTLSAGAPGQDFIISPGYGSYGVPAGSIVNTIESGQAFFLQGTAGPRNVTFVETAKVNSAHLLSFAPGNEETVAGVLSIRSGSAVTVIDGFMSRMKAGSSTIVDHNDARKFSNTNENVAVIRDNTLLAMEYRSPADENDTIFISMSAMRTKDYEWNVTLRNMDKPGRVGYLVDQYLAVETPLNLSGNTIYDFSVNTSVAASAAANRFYILFRPATVVPVTLTSISAVRQADKTILVKWSAENELNIDHYIVERSADGLMFSAEGSTLPTGNNGGAAQYYMTDHKPLTADNYYRIAAFSNSGQQQRSAIVKVGPVLPDESISIHTNPVIGRVMNIRFANKATGKYSLQVLNKIGQTVYTGSVKVSGSNEVLSVRLNTSMAAGSYQLLVRNEVGKKEVINIILE